MSAWEYKYINITGEIMDLRAKGRENESANILEIEIMNRYGAEGWDITIPPIGSWLAKRQIKAKKNG